jgi:hypothetical protein
MLSFLPDMPATPGPGPLVPGGLSAPAATPGVGLPGTGTGLGTGSDFAGLLDAALPRGGTMTAVSAEGLETLAPSPLAAPPAAAPTGKSLPLPGTALPPMASETLRAPAPVEPILPTAATPLAPAPTPAPAPRGGIRLAQGESDSAEVSPDLASIPTSADSEADTDSAAPTPSAAATQDTVALPPNLAAAAPLMPQAGPDNAPSALPAAEATAAEATGTAVSAVAIPPATGAATATALPAPPALAFAPPPAPRPLERGGIAPLPARVMLPANSPASSPASPLTTEDSAPTTPAEGLPEALSQPAQPAPPTGQSAAPQQPLAPGLIAAAASAAPQPAPNPTEPAAPAAPTLEQTIAQADTLREALRAARPEMTLRHAEFGAVSLRLEATGSESWRAVLAARDPGFVPAIQAALAERAVTAASATDTAGSFLGQNGTSDQRYGASPNGGQGGHSPHLSQSGTRDGEAAPDHRRPSTAATLAGRDQPEAGEEAPGSRSARQSRGLFA